MQISNDHFVALLESRKLNDVLGSVDRRGQDEFER